MPKTTSSESVLHDWVHNLTFQMQALLLTGIRGADTMSKHNAAKAIVRYLRSAVLKPAGDWHGANDNDFMWGDYNVFEEYARAFWEDHDQYPHHFIMHLVHCAEVIGYKHPNMSVQLLWRTFYCNGCDSFHMGEETHEQMDKRLNDFGFSNAKKISNE